MNQTELVNKLTSSIIKVLKDEQFDELPAYAVLGALTFISHTISQEVLEDSADDVTAN